MHERERGGAAEHGYWLLAIGYWLLAIGYWLLADRKDTLFETFQWLSPAPKRHELRSRLDMEAGVGDYRKLEVWQRARLLTLRVYQITQRFPATERFGVVAQMRSAAVAIMSNLAEGSGRNGDGELSRFLAIAQGSAAELECQTLLARDLGFSNHDQAGEVLAEVATIRRMLARFSCRVRAARQVVDRRPRSADSG